MRQYQVDLSALPLMLQQLIKDEIDCTYDMVVFERQQETGQNPDAYVIAVKDDETDDLPLRILSDQPTCAVVAISETSDELSTYELRYHQNRFKETSATLLIDHIRESLKRRLSRIDSEEALPLV